MELCLIWAQDRYGAIGRAGQRPWRLPEDLVHFKHTTMGSPLIMGRRTWEAIGSKPLPGRMNIVLSHKMPARPLQGASHMPHLNDALSLAGTAHPAKVFVIGGASVFARTLAVAERLYVTEVDIEITDADTHAPDVSPLKWQRSYEGPRLQSSTGLHYRHVEYRAVRNR